MQTQQLTAENASCVCVFVSCVLNKRYACVTILREPITVTWFPSFFRVCVFATVPRGSPQDAKELSVSPNCLSAQNGPVFFLSRHLRRYSVVYPLLDYLNYTQKVLHWLDCNEIDWEIIDFQFLLSDLMNIRSVIVLTSSQATIWTIWRSDRAW
jgi:hypothetical protein